jgi:hypothetical protein
VRTAATKARAGIDRGGAELVLVVSPAAVPSAAAPQTPVARGGLSARPPASPLGRRCSRRSRQRSRPSPRSSPRRPWRGSVAFVDYLACLSQAQHGFRVRAVNGQAQDARAASTCEVPATLRTAGPPNEASLSRRAKEIPTEECWGRSRQGSRRRLLVGVGDGQRHRGGVDPGPAAAALLLSLEVGRLAPKSRASREEWATNYGATAMSTGRPLAMNAANTESTA